MVLVYSASKGLSAMTLAIVGTARAIAHSYSVFATGGRELGLRRETLNLLAGAALVTMFDYIRRLLDCPSPDSRDSDSARAAKALGDESVYETELRKRGLGWKTTLEGRQVNDSRDE